MEDEQIVQSVSSTQHPSQQLTRSKVGMFSLVVMLCLVIGIYNWFTHLQTYLQQHTIESWDHYQITKVLELSNEFSFEEAVLRYKFYLIFVCGYVEPNILLALAILLTFSILLSIERQTATTVIFYEYNGISIYLQLLRLGLDLFQYFITGRCFCLNSGAAAVWFNMTTKYIYHRLPQLINHPGKLITLLCLYLLGAVMIVIRGRIDLLIAVLIAVVELAWMGGGTVKFPKLVYHQKQQWAEKISLNKLRIWQPFKWNQYRDNELMCVDNHQFYISREERMAGSY